MTRAAFVYTKELSQHVLRKDHPLQPARLQAAYELLAAYKAFELSEVVRPAPAPESSLLSFHTQDYVDAVKLLSQGKKIVNARKYNFDGHGDNPAFPGMFEASLLTMGATLTATDLVLNKSCDTAFSISGGLHHAMPDHASGFCTFNDVVIAINRILEKGLKVAYIDIDAHHSDGVQAAFYETDRVLNISLHESGRFLFPGTGEAEEIGVGKGEGYSVNIPLAPHTDDEIYVGVFNEIVVPLVEKFRADVLVTQMGCDTHFLDPLTHLQLSTAGYSSVVKKMRSFGLPWVALGGGGYDIGAVARCWAMAYGYMLGREWDDEIPAPFRKAYSVKRLRDSEPARQYLADIEQARRFAGQSTATVKNLVFPIHRIAS